MESVEYLSMFFVCMWKEPPTCVVVGNLFKVNGVICYPMKFFYVLLTFSYIVRQWNITIAPRAISFEKFPFYYEDRFRTVIGLIISQKLCEIQFYCL